MVYDCGFVSRLVHRAGHQKQGRDSFLILTKDRGELAKNYTI